MRRAQPATTTSGGSVDAPVNARAAAVIVLGALNVDERVRVARLPRPGETAVGPRFERGLGGKGANQAVAAARAGTRTRMVGAVGDDDGGRWARETLRAEGVGVDGVATVDDPTGKAVIAVDDEAENLILVGLGAGARVPEDVIDVAVARAARGDLLLLQLELPERLAQRAARRASGAGLRVVLNAAPAPGAPLSWLDDVDVLVVNVPEAAALAGDLAPSSPGGPDPAALAAALADHTGVAVVCTAGEAGAAAAQARH